MPPRPKRSVQHSIAKSQRVTTHTLRHQSRSARERRQRWLIFLAAAALILTIGMVPALGYYREVLAKGDQPIAEVDGQSISTETYAKAIGFNKLLVQAQISRVQVSLGKLTEDESASAQAQRQVLRQQSDVLRGSEASLEQTTLDDLIEGQLIRDESSRRGLSVGQAVMDEALRRTLNPSTGMSLPLLFPQTITAMTGLSESVQFSLEEAQTMLAGIVGESTFLSPPEFRTLIQEPNALRDILRRAIESEAPTTAEQVRARHILVDSEDEANTIVERLDAGEDFADLARELSKDSSNKEKGGDLGWFPRGVMVSEVEEAAFSLAAGQRSIPVPTSFGYHVIEVEEGPITRELEPALLEQMRSRRFDEWISSQTKADSLTVRRYFSADKLNWARRYVTERLSDR